VVIDVDDLIGTAIDDQLRDHVEVPVEGGDRPAVLREDAGLAHREIRPVQHARDVEEQPVGHGAWESTFGSGEEMLPRPPGEGRFEKGRDNG
jgi:hypothetical protein